ncbi:MAG: HutD family protein [Proteobacteria bacterium]|nr:HutD family protein [Pseudomonadota bacterium]
MIDLAAIAPQRWKNDAGLTREIALGPAGAGLDDFGWRLSVAELERDAPFSAFPGIDRCIVVIAGAGMALHDAAGAPVRTLAPLEPWAFEGERALHARLAHGPCRDFNVMTRRGAWRAELQVLREPAPLARGDVTALLVAQGRWQLGGERCDVLQGLLLEGTGEAVQALPLEADAALLHVRLCHDRRP